MRGSNQFPDSQRDRARLIPSILAGTIERIVIVFFTALMGLPGCKSPISAAHALRLVD